MPPFLSKLFALVAAIVIWKVFMSMINGARTMKRSMDEDAEREGLADDGKGPVPQARRDFLDLWQEAAKALGCKFEPGDSADGKNASISGHFSGRNILIKRFGHNYVRYFVEMRRTPGIQVCVVRDLDTIAERILDGHPIFPSRMFFPSSEPAFFCSADSEDAFDRFLAVPSNRSAVLNLVRHFPACTFNPEGVSVRLRASTPDVSVIDAMSAIANALESPSDTPMPDIQLQRTDKKRRVSPSVAESQDFDVPPEREDTPKRHSPLKVDVSSDTARLRRMRDDAASRKTTIICINSDDAEDFAKQRTTHLNIAEDVSEPAESVEATGTTEFPDEAPAAPETPANAPDADSPLSIGSVCATLFTKPFPGNEERAAFDAMKGQRVRWQGELLAAMPFSMDFVFGSTRGVKATLAVWKVRQSKFGVPVQIKVVAAFAPELQRDLDAAKGRTITFEGTLLKFEPFAHEIYLQDATIAS